MTSITSAPQHLLRLSFKHMTQKLNKSPLLLNLLLFLLHIIQTIYRVIKPTISRIFQRLQILLNILFCICKSVFVDQCIGLFSSVCLHLFDKSEIVIPTIFHSPHQLPTCLLLTILLLLVLGLHLSGNIQLDIGIGQKVIDRRLASFMVLHGLIKMFSFSHDSLLRKVTILLKLNTLVIDAPHPIR